MNPPPRQFTKGAFSAALFSRATLIGAAASTRQVATAILLTIGLALMTGCQGFGAGGTGTARTPATLASNQASLAFGNVTVGTTQTLPAKITNSGSSSVTISQLGISGTGFALSGI